MTATDEQPSDELGRGNLTMSKRIQLLERDRAQQSRIITELVTKANQGFSAEQLSQIKSAMREGLADVGLRIESEEHQDEAREDFRFLRNLRRAWDGSAKKIGNAILAAVVVVASGIVATGFWAWISSGGKSP